MGKSAVVSRATGLTALLEERLHDLNSQIFP